MKRILAPILLALTFSVMFSSTSFAEWKRVSKNEWGNTFYVDFERIRKHGGYVYFWRLCDYLKPNEDGDFSDKVYFQGDCKLFRFKILSGSFHTQPMGGGTYSSTKNPKNPQWGYPPPNDVMEVMLNRVCAYAK